MLFHGDISAAFNEEIDFAKLLHLRLLPAPIDSTLNFHENFSIMVASA